jgi:xylan 1,4-beta-xylosidase
MLLRSLALAISLPVAAVLDAGQAQTVSFSHFEYSGHDDVFSTPLQDDQYRNPILPGFYPDPSICRAGDDFYLINSTFAYSPGIPIFHSRDLVNWTQIGNVIHRPEQLNYDGLGVSRAIFAPALSYHKGTFYVICTQVDGGGNFVVTATDPRGPWSDPTWLSFEGIDPSLFFDSDGRAWLVNNGAPDEKPRYNGHRAIWLQEFDPAAKKLIGPRKVLVNGGVDLSKKPIWIEGPHLYKRGEWYYLCCAEGGTSDGHSQVILRSKTVDGPFVPWEQNPILTQRDLDGSAPGAVTSTGHADLVIGPDGNWWSIFLGCRPYEGKFYATGRETFLLPVTWTHDGWPVILAPGKRVPFVETSPVVHGKPVARNSALRPLNGNFTDRDEFNQPALDLSWIMLRQPHTTWWKLDPRNGGQLELTAQTEKLSGKGNPSFLARRLQHQRFNAQTELTVPAATALSAGMVAFQNETHHFYLGIKRLNDHELRVFLERYNGGSAPELVASKDISTTSQLTLRITGEIAQGSFAYAPDGKTWTVLTENVDLRVLTTHVAGGFVGAVLGVHARLEP